MNRFVHLITATSILLHSTLGCCAHGAEVTSEEGAEHLVCHLVGHDEVGHLVNHDEVAEHHDACHQLSAEENATLASWPESFSLDEQHSHHHHSHECLHAKCEWPAPQVRACVALFLCNTVAGFWGADTLAECEADGVSFFATAADHSWHALSVRSHLAHCVFLI